MLEFKIKKEPLLAIINGSKRSEMRVFSPYYIDKIGAVMPADDNEPIDFLLKLVNGYSANAPYIVVRITETHIKPLDDQKIIYIDTYGVFWQLPDFPDDCDASDWFLEHAVECNETNTIFELEISEITERKGI